MSNSRPNSPTSPTSPGSPESAPPRRLRPKSLPNSRESSPAPEGAAGAAAAPNPSVKKKIMEKLSHRKSSGGSSSSESLTRKDSGLELFSSLQESNSSDENLLKLIQRQDTDVNYRHRESSKQTPLHIAASGNKASIVKGLLLRQDLEVNSPTNDGFTPFLLACQRNSLDCVKVFLRDYRLDLDICEARGFSPLWHAAAQGNIMIVKEMIASGRQFSLTTPRSSDAFSFDLNPVDVARQNDHTQLVELLQAFEKDQEGVRAKIRAEVGYKDPSHADLFSVIVHLCDGYLQFVPKPHPTMNKNMAKFFRIATRLPMDLQMVVCNRAFGRPHSIISTADVEESFFSVRTVFSDQNTRTHRGACSLM